MAIYLGGRWEAVCLLVGEMLYAYHAVLRLEKGLPRLLALVPLVPLSLVVPWSAPTGLERAIYCFVFLWIVGFKLLLLACDLGPGAAPLATSSFPRFVSAMTFTLHLPPDRHRPPDLRQFSGNLVDDESTRKSGADCADSGSNGRRRRTVPDGEKERGSGEGAKPGGRRTVREGEEERESGQGDKTGRIRSWARSAAASQSATAVLLRTAAYFIAAAGLERVAHSWRARSVSYYALNFLYGFLIYFAAHFLFDAAGAVPASVLGVGFAPSFDMPFLATSVADFWGRRWNLLVNRLLRASVYNPVRTMLGGGGRRLAIASTFLVSGLMHEIIFFYVNRTRPSWEMTAFFVVNGVATAAEEVLSKWQPSLPPVPMLARRMYALGFVYLTACWLFFPPLTRTGIVDESLRELRRFVEWTTRAEFLF